jgi:hypothetical protein
VKGGAPRVAGKASWGARAAAVSLGLLAATAVAQADGGGAAGGASAARSVEEDELALLPREAWEIGRASCRERVS